MKDCSDDLKNYEKDEVLLQTATRTSLRGNRDANRDRLKRGLDKNKKSQPDEFIIQGSYAMKTMVQHATNDYDIDDGVAFDKRKLVQDDEAKTPMTPLQAKQMVKSGLVSGGAPTQPVIKKNCVRVDYASGHHVDIPVYRRTVDVLNRVKLELASGDEWRETNPREITDWFQEREKWTKQEGETDPQLRRLVRLFKDFVRVNLKGKSLSGLILTILAEEQHRSYNAREDEAFRTLIRKVRNRLLVDRVVRNPKFVSEILTKDSDGEKIDKLVELIKDTLDAMAVLDDPKCTKSEAREVWDETFKTDYFGNLEDDDQAQKAPYTPSPTEPQKPVYVRGPGTSA